MTNSKIYFKLQDDCHPGKPRKERRVSQDNRQKNSPRVDSAAQLSFRPLVALPLAVDVISFPFSKLKVLELLLGFVVLFTLALLSTTCMNKKLRFTTSKITERKWQRVGKLQNWKENKSFAYKAYMLPVFWASRRQFLPALHEENTGIADFSLSFLIQLKATTK